MSPVRPVHSTSFAPRLVHFYAPCHVAAYLFDPALILFTLSARLLVSLPSSESAFSVVRVRPDDRPMRPSRRGPSHRQIDPCFLSYGGAASAAELSVSSSKLPLVPSRLVLASSPTSWPCVSRLVIARSTGQRPQRPCLARLPSSLGSVRLGPERSK